MTTDYEAWSSAPGYVSFRITENQIISIEGDMTEVLTELRRRLMSIDCEWRDDPRTGHVWVRLPFVGRPSRRCVLSSEEKVSEEPESVTMEAHDLVFGDRRKSYGSPLQDFSRTARMWGAILGVEVTPVQVGLCMIALKISRECNMHKRDNLTDIAGYAETVNLVIAEQEVS